MEFEWDAAKAAANALKHGVTFPEATTAFADPLAAIFPDLLHSADEAREILVGHAESGRLLLIVYTERPPMIRLISARPATPAERRRHEENPQGGPDRE